MQLREANPLLTRTLKILVGFLVGSVAAFCCLNQAGTGAALEQIHRRAQPVSKGGAAAPGRLTNVASQRDAGMQNEISLDKPEALRSIRKAADQGDAHAQARLGAIYKDGKGAPRDDAVAAGWYHKAADQGLAQAQFDLGRMYATGRGVDQDFAQAAVWYRKAAEQRLAAAQFNLGYMYLKGRGLEQDLAQAAQWYRKAADQGDGGAQYSLGLGYEKGSGVRQDSVQAIEWLILATTSGVPEAEKMLETLERRATPSQIAEAQALASQWQRRAAEAADRRLQD